MVRLTLECNDTVVGLSSSKGFAPIAVLFTVEKSLSAIRSCLHDVVPTTYESDYAAVG